MSRVKSVKQRQADADKLVRVTFMARRGDLREIDALAALRGARRAVLLREALGWLVAKETAWLERARRIDALKADEEAEYQRALRRSAKRAREAESL